jgi:hypothetical protein
MMGMNLTRLRPPLSSEESKKGELYEALLPLYERGDPEREGNGSVAFRPGAYADELNRSLSVAPEGADPVEFTLKPGERQAISFRIKSRSLDPRAAVMMRKYPALIRNIQIVY